jgi:hypothetical protein
MRGYERAIIDKAFDLKDSRLSVARRHARTSRSANSVRGADRAILSRMKLARILLIAFAVVMVGTIASAAPGGVHGKPTPSLSVAVSDSQEPTETEAPEPTETEAPEAEATTSDRTGTPPDFSGCVGLTGLDNAICRHEALLQVKPHNPGLANSLGHLQANAAAHAAKAVGTNGNSGTHRNSGSHGPSGS